MRFHQPALAALVLVLVIGSAAPAGAAVTPPAVRALELPAGVTSISASDPLLAPILNGATSTTGGQVVHNLGGATLPLGKTQVTWRALSDNATLTKYIYLYPYGCQVLGSASNLRVFEHNGARHILYDRDNRVHVIYNDGVKVWYRLGVRQGTRLQWQPPVQLNDDATPIGMATYGTRGETFALVYDALGRVNLQCTWSTIWPNNRSVVTRRLVVDAAGGVTAGPITDTGLIGSFQCIAADSTGRLHLAVEVYSAMAYSWSDDGLAWNNTQTWTASQTNCTAYRFPNLVIDAKDRIHLLWQAEGYQNYQGSGGRGLWWIGLYSVRNAQTGTWSTPTNVLSGMTDWRAPTSGQQTLFAYPNLLLDDHDNLHLAWHGTARSHIFAWDDVYYMEKVYTSTTDSWGAWTNYATLHKRDHFNTGDGEDMNYTWVPSMAYKPGSDMLYAVIMFGLGDDEVDDPAVNLTDGILKTRIGGIWPAGFQNVTQTSGLKSWYPNVPTKVLVDRNGRSWLDIIWVDGTLDDYNIIFRRLDLGGALDGDCNGDGHVDIVDLMAVAASWGKVAGDAGYDFVCDFNDDNIVDVVDLLRLAGNWGR